jgi:hypothetical protein
MMMAIDSECTAARRRATPEWRSLAINSALRSEFRASGESAAAAATSSISDQCRSGPGATVTGGWQLVQVVRRSHESPSPRAEFRVAADGRGISTSGSDESLMIKSRLRTECRTQGPGHVIMMPLPSPAVTVADSDSDPGGRAAGTETAARPAVSAFARSRCTGKCLHHRASGSVTASH